jgi:hypothetical protein
MISTFIDVHFGEDAFGRYGQGHHFKMKKKLVIKDGQ